MCPFRKRKHIVVCFNFKMIIDICWISTSSVFPILNQNDVYNVLNYLIMLEIHTKCKSEQVLISRGQCKCHLINVYHFNISLIRIIFSQSCSDALWCKEKRKYDISQEERGRISAGERYICVGWHESLASGGVVVMSSSLRDRDQPGKNMWTLTNDLSGSSSSWGVAPVAPPTVSPASQPGGH